MPSSAPAGQSPYETEQGYVLDLSQKDIQDEVASTPMLQDMIQQTHRVSFNQTALESVTLEIDPEDNTVQESDPERLKVSERPWGACKCMCECGASFERENAAQEHLEVVSVLRESDSRWDFGNPLEFKEKRHEATPNPAEKDIDRDDLVTLEVRSNKRGWIGTDEISHDVIGLVVSEPSVVDAYLTLHGRREVPLPPRYEFGSWRLTPRDSDVTSRTTEDTTYCTVGDKSNPEEVMFEPAQVEAALRYLTDGQPYNTTEFMLYDCGTAFPLLESHDGTAIVFSPAFAD